MPEKGTFPFERGERKEKKAKLPKGEARAVLMPRKRATGARRKKAHPECTVTREEGKKKIADVGKEKSPTKSTGQRKELSYPNQPLPGRGRYRERRGTPAHREQKNQASALQSHHQKLPRAASRGKNRKEKREFAQGHGKKKPDNTQSTGDPNGLESLP